MTPLRILVAALCAAPLMASAATYTTIDSDQSQVQFYYQQMGVKMDGQFTQLQGELEFNTEQPEAAKVNLQVAMESADTGLAEANEEVQKKTWFNAAEFPAAHFTSTQIEQTADNEFKVSGVLSIKGHEQNIEFPATFTEDNSQATFKGQFSLLRNDYAIGEGSWSSSDIVGNDIGIEFTVVATE